MQSLAIAVVLIIGIQVAVYVIMRRANNKQHIYEDAPARHQEKTKTMTMGGIGILLSACMGWGLVVNFSWQSVWLIGLVLIYGLIGLVDDGISQRAKQNKGLSARQKFFAQSVVAAAAIISLSLVQGPTSLLMGCFYVFLIVGTANATNLTDGLDGLLSTTWLASMAALMASDSLTLELQGVCLIMIVSVSVFLLFNAYPAKLFMGDTGSLALGACLAGLCIISNQPFAMIPLGSIFIIETISVIVQVTMFKTRQTRLFLMSPLHHHFELLGLSEKQVWALFLVIHLVGVGAFLWT